jgi:hypothetical protein
MNNGIDMYPHTCVNILSFLFKPITRYQLAIDMLKYPYSCTRNNVPQWRATALIIIIFIHRRSANVNVNIEVT